ncbi:hypothetical protein [Legionella waltersii]|uniref:Substrate of the Dot/Icm secretion system n=1 Tax=Legionella waltersii TaxID=66969 RepID=A0A0W1A0R6_9GAMM|nr:hypothetical protein [Legionella waltersii]KTD74720.1 substrate of the Dot/Icm secretion system [Legionella waltersii]SNV00046.1 Dot/Icm secretion system substrate [Legionella waltersii]
MTFALKGYKELKAHFQETVTIFLKRSEKEKIEQLDNPRRDALQFLTSVISELDRRIEELTARSPNLLPYSRMLYGAMLVVCKDIEKQEGYVLGKKENSLLYTRLMDGMGINSESTPSFSEYTDFYVSFNQLTNLIFENNDSREGLKPETAFKKIPGDKLVALTMLGYQLEEWAQTNFVKNLPKDGKSKQPKITEFSPTSKTPKSLVEQFESFKKLQETLHELETSELAKKNKGNVKLLANPARATQFQFLKAISKAAQDSGLSDEDKLAVLVGAMYIVRGEIAEEYKKIPLYKKAIESSVTHKGLTNILKSTDECYEDMGVFLKAVNQFIRFQTIENANIDNKVPTVRAKHMFSDIAGFDLTATLSLIQKMLHDSKELALNTCLDDVKKKQEASQPKSSRFSLFSNFSLGYGKSKESDLSEEEEEEDEQKAEMKH